MRVVRRGLGRQVLQLLQLAIAPAPLDLQGVRYAEGVAIPVAGSHAPTGRQAGNLLVGELSEFLGCRYESHVTTKISGKPIRSWTIGPGWISCQQCWTRTRRLQPLRREWRARDLRGPCLRILADRRAARRPKRTYYSIAWRTGGSSPARIPELSTSNGNRSRAGKIVTAPVPRAPRQFGFQCTRNSDASHRRALPGSPYRAACPQVQSLLPWLIRRLKLLAPP